MSTFLVSTKAECRYKLCGMITAPTIPRAAVKEPEGILGTNVPISISEKSGLATNIFIKNAMVITAIRKTKNASNFLTPKQWINKKKNESQIVINAPTQGLNPKRIVRAVADPRTS